MLLGFRARFNLWCLMWFVTGDLVAVRISWRFVFRVGLVQYGFCGVHVVFQSFGCSCWFGMDCLLLVWCLCVVDGLGLVGFGVWYWLGGVVFSGLICAILWVLG